MDKQFEEKFHLTEEWNWWFVARRYTLVNLLKSTSKTSKILDVGCGGGPLLEELKKLGFENISGVDISDQAVEKCRNRGLVVSKMDANELQFEENTFDLLIVSDTLEHLEFDEKALQSFKCVLKPGGKIFVFVPAYMFLWSEHDIIHHHFRRYTKSNLTQKMRKVGFTIQRGGYWNFILLFPTTIFRLVQRLKNKIFSSPHPPKDQLAGINPFTNKLFLNWMKAENKIFNSVPFPCGVTVFVEATKK